MMKRIIAAVCLVSLAFCLAGCGGGAGDGAATQDAAKTQSASFKIEELDWTVEEGVVDGNRKVVMSYTNNSKFNICDFRIVFAAKGDVTEEQVDGVLLDLKESYGLDTSLEELRSRTAKAGGLTMVADADVLVQAGSSTSNVPLEYFGGSLSARDFAHYELLEPDIATIQYIDEGMIRTVDYDFKSQKYTVSPDEVVARQWVTSEMGKVVPEPDAEVLIIGFETERSFDFVAKGVSPKDFAAYVESVKERGFSIKSYRGGEGKYWENDRTPEDLYVSLSYDVATMTVEGDVSVPEGWKAAGESSASSSAFSSALKAGASSPGESVSTSRASAAGVTPEFKAAMDEYEVFFAEYAAFMKEYANAADPSALAADYASFMKRYTETMTALGKVDTAKLSEADLAYYTEVNARIVKMLGEVA